MKRIDVLERSPFPRLFSRINFGSVFVFWIVILEKIRSMEKIYVSTYLCFRKTRSRTWKLGFWIQKGNATQYFFCVSSFGLAPVRFNP